MEDSIPNGSVIGYEGLFVVFCLRMERYLLKISVIYAFIFLHSLPCFFILLLLFLFFRAFFVALLSD